MIFISSEMPLPISV